MRVRRWWQGALRLRAASPCGGSAWRGRKPVHAGAGNYEFLRSRLTAVLAACRCWGAEGCGRPLSCVPLCLGQTRSQVCVRYTHSHVNTMRSRTSQTGRDRWSLNGAAQALLHC